MTELVQDNSPFTDMQQPAQSLPPESVEFCSIEEMQEICEPEGWSVQYRQIAPGVLKAHSTPGMAGSISLLAETVSHRVEVVGSIPVTHVAILDDSCSGLYEDWEDLHQS